MSFLDEAIYERENSLEREVIDGQSGDENDGRDPFDVLGLGDGDGDGKPTSEKIELEAKKIKRRVNVVRLNPEKLTGPRGIHKIENEFKDVKYKGKGHEKEDLDKVIQHLSHWAHRLFPKYNFDDCLTAIETQGKKRAVQSFLHKYRNDDLDEDIVRNVNDSDEEDGQRKADGMEVPVEFDEMDQMISEQISKTTNVFNNTMESDLGVRELDITRSSISSQRTMVPQASSTLTEEQIQMIQENKRKAIERLKNRRLGISNQNSQIGIMNSTSNLVRTEQSQNMSIVVEEDIDMADLVPQNLNVTTINNARSVSPTQEEMELLDDVDF